MDRNSIIALVLIFLIFLLWEPYVRLIYPPDDTPETVEQFLEPEQDVEVSPLQEAFQTQPGREALLPELQQKQTGSIQRTDLPERRIVVESEFYSGVISSKGGTLAEWSLKNFPDPTGFPVNIIRDNDIGNLGISFFSSEGFQIDLSKFDFIPENMEYASNSYIIDLTNSSNPRTLTLAADLGSNRIVRKRFTFYPTGYDIDLTIEFENCQTLIHNQEYVLVWGSGIRTSEQNVEDDMQFSKTMTLYGSSVEKFDIQSDPEKSDRPLNGDIHWIVTRSKYFCSLIIPKDVPGISAEFSGKNIPLEEHLGRKNYTTKLVMGYTPTSPVSSDNFSVYLGPVDYDEFKILESKIGNGLQLKHILDINSWIREFSMLIHRIFNMLHQFIPNYGLVIIVFSFLINLLMFPLTAKSYKSMKKMQDLQPLLSELKDKYPKEPKKIQEAQMRLYKEHKVNPVGGCLPMLLQMPVFFSIYPIFRSIELRGAPFFGWITDLSKPDTVAMIPSVLPFDNLMYGTQINILTFIYAGLMFVQQKVMMKDPKQKAMVYLMPIMMLVFFNRLSSGFILYFIIFLLLSIVQRHFVHTDPVKGKEKIISPISVKSQAKKPRKKGKKK
jgi:YidC/Oxa1 family membrane protein insertase